MKYYLVAYNRSIFLKLMKDMLDLSKSICQHTDLQRTRILRDDPFSSVQQDLVCLSTGKEAPPEIQQDLLITKAVGEKAYLKPSSTSQSPRQSCKHLASWTKRCKSGTKRPKRSSWNRNLFAQIIPIAENRKLQMREVLSHPRGALPGRYPLPMDHHEEKQTR